MRITVGSVGVRRRGQWADGGGGGLAGAPAVQAHHPHAGVAMLPCVAFCRLTGLQAHVCGPSEVGLGGGAGGGAFAWWSGWAWCGSSAVGMRLAGLRLHSALISRHPKQPPTPTPARIHTCVSAPPTRVGHRASGDTIHGVLHCPWRAGRRSLKIVLLCCGTHHTDTDTGRWQA